MNDLLTKLVSEPRWDIARSVYGSCHHTLNGLLAQWWIGIGQQHRVMDEAPRYERNKGSDLILLNGQFAVGVVEVEGGWKHDAEKRRRGEVVSNDPHSKYLEAIDRIGYYFAHKDPDWHTLEFGVFLAYPCVLRGSREERKFVPVPAKEIIEYGRRLIKREENTKRQLYILTLDKELDTELGSLFQRTSYHKKREFHQGRPSQINGTLIYCQDEEAITINHPGPLILREPFESSDSC